MFRNINKQLSFIFKNILSILSVGYFFGGLLFIIAGIYQITFLKSVVINGYDNFADEIIYNNIFEI